MTALNATIMPSDMASAIEGTASLKNLRSEMKGVQEIESTVGVRGR